MPTLADILDLANLLLSSAVAVVAFSLLAYVLAYNVRNRVGRAFAALLTFVLGTLFGIVSADGFAAQGFGAYGSAAGVMFVGSLMKNIFEEFVWRGSPIDVSRLAPGRYVVEAQHGPTQLRGILTKLP